MTDDDTGSPLARYRAVPIPTRLPRLEELAQAELPEAFDMTAELDVAQAGTVGLDLILGDGSSLRIGFDASASVLTVDRTNSGAVPVPSFGRPHQVPLVPRDGSIDLRVLVDRSSVEVFADDGAVVFTELVFPAPGPNRIEAWSEGAPPGAMAMQIWDLTGTPGS